MEEDWDTYVDRMGHDGVYGDNLEIVAFSRTYRVSVKIYQPDLAYIIRPKEGSDGTLLHIAYHSYEHYSSIRNSAGPHSGDPCIQVVPTIVEEEKSAMSPNRAPSSLEKICLASVPGADMDTVRRVMLEVRGNVNAAVDMLLEQTYVPDDPEVNEEEPVERITDTVVETHTGNAQKSVEHGPVSPKKEAKRMSTRDRKEKAKQRQKEAARARKQANAKQPISSVPESPIDALHSGMKEIDI